MLDFQCLCVTPIPTSMFVEVCYILRSSKSKSIKNFQITTAVNVCGLMIDESVEACKRGNYLLTFGGESLC